MHCLPDVSRLRCGVILVVDLILLIWKSLSHPSFRPFTMALRPYLYFSCLRIWRLSLLEKLRKDLLSTSEFRSNSAQQDPTSLCSVDECRHCQGVAGCWPDSLLLVAVCGSVTRSCSSGQRHNNCMARFRFCDVYRLLKFQGRSK